MQSQDATIQSSELKMGSPDPIDPGSPEQPAAPPPEAPATPAGEPTAPADESPIDGDVGGEG